MMSKENRSYASEDFSLLSGPYERCIKKGLLRHSMQRKAVKCGATYRLAAQESSLMPINNKVFCSMCCHLNNNKFHSANAGKQTQMAFHLTHSRAHSRLTSRSSWKAKKSFQTIIYCMCELVRVNLTSVYVWLCCASIDFVDESTAAVEFECIKCVD